MNQNYQQMYELCKNHMHSYVLVEMNDGTKVDGIITGLDDEYVYVAVPIGQGDEQHANAYPSDQQQRQFGFGYPGYGYGVGYPGYGYGYGFGYPRRRFRRLILPLAALTALSVLPWY
ncbi:hypothetical protein [Virgibacillus salinus]|uniref:Uncharacterized protein n=1 Tax=Virgibacillus salinus TaxID=553311 RepID=A0A1H1EIB9_9BACI|nr:hypothetical protein [Virgibacillus salinus]SDQ88310.1 hypothetical protein SAMN05216231_2896 [Virgibacillus salinus]